MVTCNARLLALGILSISISAEAGEYCVTSTAEFQAALTTAKSDPDPNANIKLVSGSYSGNFLYATDTANQSSPAVEVTGGWNPTCSEQVSAESNLAGDLVFSGVTYAQYPVTLNRISMTGKLITITFGRVTIKRSEVDGGFDVRCCATGLIIDHSRFYGSSASLSTTDMFGADGTGVIIQDNLFGDKFASFDWLDQTHSPHQLIVRNNTFSFLTGGANQASPWLNVVTEYEPHFEFSRNLLTGGVGAQPTLDINLDGNGNFVPAPSNAYDNWIGTTQASITASPSSLFNGNGNVVQTFASPYLSATQPYDWHLARGNAAIDYSLPIPADNGDTDLEGSPRLIGDFVDVGAFETSVDYVFKDGFE
jgi:hypothetical protein